MNKLRGASCFSASLKAGAWTAGSLNGLALYLACAPPTPTEKLETCEGNSAATCINISR